MAQHGGKYRWRTQLRGNLPWALTRLVAKGPDCGAHDWYNADDQVDECYHCRATRPHDLADLQATRRARQEDEHERVTSPPHHSAVV